RARPFGVWRVAAALGVCVAGEVYELAQRIAAAAGVVAAGPAEVLAALDGDHARPGLAGPEAEVGPTRLTGDDIDLVADAVRRAAVERGAALAEEILVADEGRAR